MDMTFKGRAKPLDDIDLPRIGYEIGVGEDEVHALIDVEASGSPFDLQGRPKALYEPHRAYALSSGKVRAALVKAGLAYARWGEKPYPPDSYARIIAAMKIDRDVALMATSWGGTQILGEHYATLGYVSPQAMVEAFMADAENHIAGMIAFVKANHIDDDLRAHRWEMVARVYNGPGYKKNAYDVKLAKAFAKWQRIRDTPFDPARDLMPRAAVAATIAGPLPLAVAAAKDQAAPLLGLGSVLTGAIAGAVSGAIGQVAADAGNSLKSAEAPAVVDAVTKAAVEAAKPILDEAQAHIDHATNQEPWYQSRVTWGAIIAVGAGAAGILGYSFTPADQVTLANNAVEVAKAVAAVAAAIGGMITWYGRWRAASPIGR